MNFESFYKISYGLFVICTGDESAKNGYIANTAFQVTSSPAKLAISCSKDNFSEQMIRKYGHFSVSVLTQEAPKNLIRIFGYDSGKDIDKFEDDISYITGKSGVPIITSGCCAWFECKVTDTFDVGSHILFIGEVIQNNTIETSDAPLTYDYYRNVKRGIAPKNAPTYVDKTKLKKVKPSPTTEKSKCLACGYIYDSAIGDPDGGILPGTKFEDIPDDWVCPVCGATKDMFEIIR